jgi:hypothetical protein
VSFEREIKGASGVASRLAAGAFDFGESAAGAEDGIDCVCFYVRESLWACVRVREYV